MELKLYFKMLVTRYLIRLRCTSFRVWDGPGSTLLYSLPSLPEVLGACAEWCRRLSVSSVFRPAMQLVWGRVTAFWPVTELWGQVMCDFRCGSKTHCHQSVVMTEQSPSFLLGCKHTVCKMETAGTSWGTA